MDFVYLWADGIHVNVRLDDQKLCLLVMIGVRSDGRKELVALTDGYREAAESWADLLRDCRRRGMRAPVLAAGDECLNVTGTCMSPKSRRSSRMLIRFGKRRSGDSPRPTAGATISRCQLK